MAEPSSGAPPAKRLCIDLTEVSDSALPNQVVNWLTVNNSEDIAEQFGDDVDTLRTVAKRLREVAEAIDDRIREDFADDMETLVWLKKEPSFDFSSSNNAHITTKTVSAEYLVGPNKAEFYITCDYHHDPDQGDETYAAECSFASYSEESGEWIFDASDAAQLLQDSGITRFTDEVMEETYVWNASADPDERLKVLKGFMGAMISRVFDDIGDRDEYGMELGWLPGDVYDALKDY